MSRRLRPRGAIAPITTSLILVSPTSGEATDTIRVYGTRFRLGDQITVDGVAQATTGALYGKRPATDPVDAATPYLECAAPAHAAGLVPIGAIAAHAPVGGVVELEDAFEYVDEEPPPDPPANVVVHYDWSTATGQGPAAMTDNSKPLPLTLKGNGVNNIVITPPVGHGWPAGLNVYRSIADVSGGGPSRGQEVAIGASQTVGPIPTPGIGESIRYRWMQSVVLPDGLGGGNGSPHNPQNAWGGLSLSSWSWEWQVAANNLWRFQLSSFPNTSPNNHWSPWPVGTGVIAKNHAYRIEVEILRLSATTFRPNFWFFDNEEAGGDLLYSNVDMRNSNGSGSVLLTSNPVLNLNANFDTRNCTPQWGYNGTNGWFLPQYHGVELFDNSAIAIATGDGTQGPIGPYAGGV